MENTRGQGTPRKERLNEQGRNQQSSNLEQQSSSSEQRTGNRQQNVSTERGTSDMRSDSLSGVSHTPARSGSITEKKSVTGSDYDGQISEE